MNTSIAVALSAALVLGACSAEQVTDNTVDAAKLGSRVVVNTAVGAAKLGYRAGAYTYNTVAEARSPSGQAFPEGAALCPTGEGAYVQATMNADGTVVCPTP